MASPRPVGANELNATFEEFALYGAKPVFYYYQPLFGCRQRLHPLL